MRRHRPPSDRSRHSFAPWALALALVLKAALPLLLAVAAGLQHKAAYELCPVFGVDTVHAMHAMQTVHALHAVSDEDASDETHRHSGAPDKTPQPHRGDHCALGGLPLLAGAPEVRVSPPCAPGAVARDAATAATPPCHDAAARWVARQKHGPPARA